MDKDNTQSFSDFTHCPFCLLPIELKPINCSIFRCGGVWNSLEYTFKQFPQHAKKKEIQDIIAKTDTVDGSIIIGCGKPLKFNEEKNRMELATWDS